METEERKYSKKEIAWLIGLMLSAAVIVTITNLIVISWDWSLFPYLYLGNYASYYYTYFEFGFIKRGLAASFIRLFAGNPDLTTIQCVGYTLALATSGAGGYALYRLRNYLDQASFILLSAFILFNSGTFLNLGYGMGRLDQLLIICSLISLYAIINRNVIMLSIISMIALLIHELYLLMFLPMIFYVALFHSKLSIRQVGIVSVGVGLVAALLIFYGKIEGMSIEQMGKLIPVAGAEVADYGIIWKRSLMDNIMYTQKEMAGLFPFQIISLFIGAGYTITVYLLLASISLYNNMDWKGYPVIMLTAAVIFFLAIDYSRWYSLMIINAFLYFGYCAIFEIDEYHRVKLTRTHEIVIILLIFISLVLGPIGIVDSFPMAPVI